MKRPNKKIKDFQLYAENIVSGTQIPSHPLRVRLPDGHGRLYCRSFFLGKGIIKGYKKQFCKGIDNAKIRLIKQKNQVNCSKEYFNKLRKEKRKVLIVESFKGFSCTKESNNSAEVSSIP